MQTREELARINAEFNAIPYRAELTDNWTPATLGIMGILDGSDCDSYATAKMQALHKAGWPVDVMRLAECKTETGGLHAVLLVDYAGQTLVLDNRRPEMVLMEHCGYTFTRIQVAGTPKWEFA